MDIEPDATRGFAGMTIAALESRMADQMAKLIARYGGDPLVAPSLQEIPLEDNTEALDFAKDLMAGTVDLLILLTGVGTRTLVDVWKTRFTLEAIRQALTKTTLVCRGPKPIAALKELGLKPHITVPEPNTWRDILHTLDDWRPEGLSGLRLAIQEYGIANTNLAQGLTERDALVRSVTVYRWALPDDVEPLKRTLRSIMDGNVSVLLFTSAAQVDHVVKLLETTGELAGFLDALGKTVVASIGPITSQRLRHHQFPVDFEPSHAKMGVLVKEASEQAREILARKS
ncbi:MAG: uroporphyrinogen-III synthase [Nitrospira sp. SB0672_bin_25]|nr:uroporphyrinogen-III synthase [Nitrospira sp. SB0666_bin_27]MYF24849.1 uroporphyrinogen-III synthase [Nitrospira sp. SB0678_bin_10]MYJ53608.1 uroporphyrinogen-III synthase [Nitrospira sp. SB0672_bin_25]